jgi:hypothetical protein
MSEVTSTPNVPDSTATTSKGSVKVATPDIVRAVTDIPYPVEVMTSLVLEAIGGQELINIARSDTINGQNVVYQPISNARELFTEYNPQNILFLPNTSDKFFNNFPIKLDEKIPQSIEENVSISDSGILIQLVNMGEDEQVEVQILSTGEVLNDTIY